MLLFILAGSIKTEALSTFQYITCYSLSLTNNTNITYGGSFNTSHVTLYRFPDIKNQKTNVVSIHHMLLFITFREHTLHGCSFVSIHHMLLFIGQMLTSICREFGGFNTSHVTLYLQPARLRRKCSRVSIHHMLLFINNRDGGHSRKLRFQYITCYSLSFQEVK